MSDVELIREALGHLGPFRSEAALVALARVEATLSELKAINRQMSAAEGPQRLAAAEARAVAAEAERDAYRERESEVNVVRQANEVRAIEAEWRVGAAEAERDDAERRVAALTDALKLIANEGNAARGSWARAIADAALRATRAQPSAKEPAPSPDAECDCEGEDQCPRGIRDALCSPAPAEPPREPHKMERLAGFLENWDAIGSPPAEPPERTETP